MNSHEQTSLRGRVLRTDDELRDLLELLLQQANQRQMWLLFIDAQGRLGEPIMPMDDYPEDPHELTTVDDIGEVSQSHLLMHRIGLLCEATGNAGAVLVWERIGGSQVGADDRAWASAMAQGSRELEVPLRAQFVLHNRGVRQIQVDDYL